MDEQFDFEIDGLEVFVNDFLYSVPHEPVDSDHPVDVEKSLCQIPIDAFGKQGDGVEVEENPRQSESCSLQEYAPTNDDLTIHIPVLDNDVIHQALDSVSKTIPKTIQKNVEDYNEYMLPLLSTKFHYEMMAFNKGAHEETFYAQLKCNISSKEDISDFVEDYQETTKQTLRISKTYGACNSGSQLQQNFTMRFRCQHNTRSKCLYAPGRRIKNTICPFFISFKIKFEGSKTNDDDKHCFIDFKHQHNHAVTPLNALSFRDCSRDSKEKMFKLFENRYTPSLAYGAFKKELRESCKSDTEFELKFADRSIMPRLTDFKYYYKLFNSSLYGAKNGEKLISRLNDKVSQYNEKFKAQDGKMKHKLTVDQVSKRVKLVLAIVTPLMARVHKHLLHSSELVFSDSTSNLDDHNLRFLMLCTHSVAGGLPLAIIIMSDETEETFNEAFELLKECLPVYAFFNRGTELGPMVFLTDNCSEERIALSSSWPNARLMLCTFHVLQAIWRWLFDKKNKIMQDDRPTIMKCIKKVMYSFTDSDAKEHAESMLQSEIVQRSPLFKAYYEEYVQPNIAYWCLAYRTSLPIRGNHTQNYAESQFLVIKQEMLQRVKSYNVIELIDMVIGDLEQHYQDKLLKVANGSLDGTYSKRYTATKQKDIDPDNVIALDKDLGFYSVLSSSSSGVLYDIDILSGFCSCPVGSDGSPCKHQFAVKKKFKIGNDNFLPVFSQNERRGYAQIAHEEALPIEFYQDFTQICDSDGVEAGVDPPSNASEFTLPCADVIVSNECLSEECPISIQITPSTETALRSFEDAVDVIKNAIRTGDSNVLTGITKFSAKVCKMSHGKLGSALHCFDNKFVGKQSIVHSKFKIVGRAKKNFRRGAIGVLPDAVKRRKGPSKTRKALMKGSKQIDTPLLLDDNTRQSKKRTHCLATILEQNVPAAKKAGRAMHSRCKPSYKKKQKTAK